MKCLILDCGGVLAYPRLGDWNLPFGAARILGDRVQSLQGSRGLLAHRESARWLDESRLVKDTAEELTLRREYIASLDRLLGLRMTPAEIEALAGDFTYNADRFGYFDGVNEWLRRWKQDYRLAMLSDAMPSTVDFMKQRGIYDLLDACVISTQVGALKPDRRMYEAMLDALNARPEDCLFVDDRACNVEGAVAVGMHAVQMAHPEFLPDALWDGPVARGYESLDRLLKDGGVWGASR